MEPSVDRRPDDAALGAAAEAAAAFLRGAAQRPIRPEADRAALRAGLSGPLPDDLSDVREVIDTLVAGVDPGPLISQSPRFFGFVVGGAHPAAVAADWLASA